MELFEVRESLRRRLKAWLLAINSFSKELFRTDLGWRGRLVPDPRRAS
jgi:hypothetical protein